MMTTFTFCVQMQIFQVLSLGWGVVLTVKVSNKARKTLQNLLRKHTFQLSIQLFPLFLPSYSFCICYFHLSCYFYVLCPNANFPSAVAWVGSSFNGKSVKQGKKNFAELAKKTHVSTFDSTFSSFSSFLFLLYWLLSSLIPKLRK